MPKNGVYTLIVSLVSSKEVKVGKLGKVHFEKGYYAYTGSGLRNGLQSRIFRHLRKDKRLKWHIDYLLSLKDVGIAKVIVAECNKRLECKVNKEIAKIAGSKLIVSFGSSDCKEGCRAHLIYLSKNKWFNKVLLAYKNVGLKPISFDVKN
jgi:sugar fermentation stimulation protein A